MKKESYLMYGLAALGVGYLSYELSHYAFHSGVRKEVSSRDRRVCQILGCNCTDITIHHLIPESCLNSRIDPGAGIYVDFLREVFFDVNANLNGNTKRMMMLWDSFINYSPVNGLSLCSSHHSGLHQDRLEDHELLLKANKLHPQRPKSLAIEHMGGFVVATYNNLLATSSPLK